MFGNKPGWDALERSLGLNMSENELTKIATRVFFSAWSWPNVYHRRGKELCDLLVVFGNDIVLFSDKTRKFKPDACLVDDQEWLRWKRKAVSASIGQLSSAIKKMGSSDLSLFLDSSAKTRLPIDFPKNPRIHLVGIVGGLEESQAKRKSRLTTLSLRSEPETHLSARAFSLGKCSADGHFVHILDKRGFSLASKACSTASEFIDYLRQREEMFHSLEFDDVGEEDLLCTHLYNSSTIPSSNQRLDKETIPDRLLTLGQRPDLQLRFIDRILHESDTMIDSLITHLSDLAVDAKVSLNLDNANLSEAAIGLFHLASTTRSERDRIGPAILESYLHFRKDRIPRFRLLKTSETSRTAFIISTFPDSVNSNLDEHREFRSGFVKARIYAARALNSPEGVDNWVAITCGDGNREGKNGSPPVYTGEELLFVCTAHWDRSDFEHGLEAARMLNLYTGSRHSSSASFS